MNGINMENAQLELRAWEILGNILPKPLNSPKNMIFISMVLRKDLIIKFYIFISYMVAKNYFAS